MASFRTTLLNTNSLFLRVGARAIKPLERFVTSRRMRQFESHWQASASARDALFAARVLSRYRANGFPEAELPLLPTRSTTPISPEAWDALYNPRQATKPEAEIDVIVPITDNYEIALQTLYQLLTTENSVPYRVAALLCQHPDHKLTDKLRRLQELDAFDLFIANGDETLIELANFAIQRHETRDIILLASHLHVMPEWASRLRSASALHPATTASISPMVTTGGITGYPFTSGNLAHALEDAHTLDGLCQTNFAHTAPEIIATPSTEALYIRREALHSIGLLPEKAANIQSAILGWGTTAHERGFAHYATLGTLLGATAGYVPPASSSTECSFPTQATQLDKSRLALHCTEPTLHIEAIRKPIASHLQSASHLTLGCEPHAPATLRLGTPDARLFPHLCFTLDTSFEPLSDLCHQLRITRLSVGQLAGFPARMVEWVRLFSEQSGIPYTLHITDDYLVCPGLLGVGKSCSPEDLESCYRSFNHTYPLDTDGMPLWLWRARSASLLAGASQISFASGELQSLYTRYFTFNSLTD